MKADRPRAHFGPSPQLGRKRTTKPGDKEPKAAVKKRTNADGSGAVSERIPVTNLLGVNGFQGGRLG